MINKKENLKLRTIFTSFKNTAIQYDVQVRNSKKLKFKTTTGLDCLVLPSFQNDKQAGDFKIFL
jgi:hypothetical protein